MKVWRLAGMPDNPWLVPLEWPAMEPDAPYDGRPLAPLWRVIQVERDPEEEPGAPMPDMPFFAFPAIHPLRCRAVDALADLLEGDCEVLPVLSSEGCFRLVNVTSVLDAIDFDRSVVSRNVEGEVVDVPGLWLDEEAIAGHDIFRLADSGSAEAMVTDAFKERVEQAGITGIRFVLSWDSEADEPIMVPSILPAVG